MNENLPRTPRSGDPVSADWARKVADELRAQRVIGGPGVKVSRTPNGTTVSAAIPRASGSAGGGGAGGHLAVTVSSLSNAPVRPTSAQSLDGGSVGLSSIRVYAMDIAGLPATTSGGMYAIGHLVTAVSAAVS